MDKLRLVFAHGRALSLIVFTLLIGACSNADDSNERRAASPDDADFAFINAKVYTSNEEAPWTETVLVKGDTIIYVGDATGAESMLGANTYTADLGGRLLMPGFIDTHMHPVQGGSYVDILFLETDGTIEEWVAAIDEYAVANPGLSVIFGIGFLASTFGPEGPHRELIDAVVPDRPVLLRDEGFHMGWVNTAALDALNITRDTPDPEPGYSFYKRDENGDATGYLLELVVDAAMDGLNVITDDGVARGFSSNVDLMNSFGITAGFDAGLSEATSVAEDVLRNIEESGELSIRLIGSWRVESADLVATALESAAQYRESFRGENYHFNTLKIPYDGTVEGRSAAMFEDYQGDPGNSGATALSVEQLNDLTVGAAAMNMDVHIHGLGERAVHDALNAVEIARKTSPATESRFTICHIQVITDQDLPRFAGLDVIAQSSPLWASYDVYGEAFVSKDQFQRFWRFKSLEDAGVRLTFGSDYPGTGAGIPGLSPFMQIEIGHTRQYPGEPDAPIQPRESERLSVASLVKGYTIDAAYQLHMEDEIGSIEVGKKADIIVLDQNIFDVNPYTIHETEVLLTMMDGEIVYEAVD